ncbi:MAG: DUF1726 domain-containing protein, partial [Gammaproteobacteria bacterium]|nr:DUF1726 domain-containing protein [Gammaproteobacteria bacterium]
MPEASTPISDWFEHLLQRLAQSRQRQLVSCQGSLPWRDEILQSVKAKNEGLLVLSNSSSGTDSVPFAKSETLLGCEYRVVVVDLCHGLNADVIAIAGGLVKAGGLLLLLSEEPSKWGQVEDRYAIWQNCATSHKYLFIEYFFKRMAASPAAVAEICESQPLPAMVDLLSGDVTAVVDGQTDEQRHIVQAVKHWVSSSKPGIALIAADRGRGKSFCLGLIADELVGSLHLSVCITAYSRKSAATLLAQLDTANFVSPDQLIASPQKAELLLIDEAAMLPYPMLTELCKSYRHVIMATTTGGYEGTGQGFQLRFLARLPGFMRFEIHAPVRWAANDALESWLDATLQLKPNLGSGKAIQPSQCRYRVLDREQIQQDT